MGTVRQDGAQERRVEIYAEIPKLHSLQEADLINGVIGIG